MQGRITRIVPPRQDPQNGHYVQGGFGFITDEDGQTRFFHARDIEGAAIADLREGQHVEFAPYEEPKTVNTTTGRTTGGLRAAHVRVTS